MKRTFHILVAAVLVFTGILFPRAAQGRSAVERESPSAVASLGASDIEGASSKRSYEDILSSIPANYPGVLGGPGGQGDSGSCLAQLPSRGPRIKDSVNWPGLAAPGSFFFDQARQGGIDGPARADIERVQVMAQPFSAEYGRGPGGTVDVTISSPKVPSPVVSETKEELEGYLAKSRSHLKKIVDKFGADNVGTAEARRILEADIQTTQDKLAALQSQAAAGEAVDFELPEYSPEDLAEIDELSRQLSPEQLRRINTDPFGDLNNDGAPAADAGEEAVIVEEITYTPEELENMTPMLTPEEIRRINTDPFGMGEEARTAKPAPKPQPGLSRDEAADLAAAFGAVLDRSVDPEDVFEAYQKNQQEYAQMTAAERAEVMERQRKYHEQQVRSEEMKLQEAERRRAVLEKLEHESATRDERRADERGAAREEVNRTTQEILSGIEEYINNAGEYDPTVLKWVSVAAEMQHETKKLADSVNRDYMRAEAKLQAIEEYRKAHAAELKDKPWVELALIDMEYAAATLKNDAERVWLMTKELVWYGAVIDVATFWATAAAKGVGVARQAAQRAAMQATLDAARKPTAYVVGDVMVDAAGKGAEAAAERFMGTAGTKTVTATVQAAAGAGAQTAVTQATGQAVEQIGDSVIAPGVKEILAGPEIGRTFWLKLNILAKGAEAETRRLAQQAVEMGISEAEVKAAGNSPEAIARLIVEKLGLQIVEFAQARPIFEISTRVMAGTATQADRQLLEKMAAESAAKGGNFFDDLARQGTFGDDGFQSLVFPETIAALKQFVGTAAGGMMDDTVRLAGQAAESAAKTVIDDALAKTVQLAPEQAGRVAADALAGAFEKTVQLAPDQAAGLADTVIDNILAKTVQLTPSQVGRFINGVADEVLEKTVLMTEEQAFRMAKTMVENLMEHAPTLTPAEIGNMATTIIGNVLDDTVRLSESQIRAFIGKVTDDVLAKTVQMSELETQKLTRSMIGQFMENATADAGAQTMRMTEAALQDAMKTQILPNQAVQVAGTVIDNIMLNTTIITKDAAVNLADTVVEGILQKTTKLTTAQAQDLISTVLLKVSEKTLLLSEREAAGLVSSVAGDVLEKTVIMTEDEVLRTVRMVVDETLVKTMKLSPEEAAGLARTAGQDVLDRMALSRAPQAPSTLARQPAVQPGAPAAPVLKTALPSAQPAAQAVAEPSGVMAEVTRAELEAEKASLLEQIAGMQKGLNEPIFKKNAELRETLTETLASAKERLAEVDGLLAQDMGALAGISAQIGQRVGTGFADDYQLLSGYQMKFGGIAGTALGLQGDYLSDEPYGELAGEAGPLLVKGTYHNEPGVAVFDSWGIPTGFITRDEARHVPGHATDLILKADWLSQRYAFEGGLGQWPPRTQSYTGYDFRPIDAGNLPPEGFVPEAVLVPQLGLSPLDALTFSDGINSQLQKGVAGEKFFDPFSCCGVVYLDEPVFDRVILKKKPAPAARVPNDPHYEDPKAERRQGMARRMKSLTGLSLGAVSFGSGSGSDKGPVIADQWGVQEVGFTPLTDPESAWNLVDAGKKNVIVAVIDSGLDLAHPDGPEHLWVNEGEIAGNGVDDDRNGFIDDVHGYNFLDNNADLTDLKGHGTNVTGIIAAKFNNSIGIAGINPGTQIMVLKVADKHGHANSLNIYRAIRYAANHGARVINISLGARGVSKLEQLAINYAYRRGVFIVVAAGNDNEDIGRYGPASRRRVFAVGATDYGGARSQISNHGANLAVLAPGEQIYTLWSRDADWSGPSGDRERRYWKATGTSFSSPIVAATASLLLAKDPGLKPVDIERILLASAADMEEVGWDEGTGAGFLDAQAALSTAPGGGLAALITELRINEEKGQFSSLDVYGTVQGELKEFTVEIGRGKKPRSWQQASGTLTRPAHNNWLCRIPAKAFKGGQEWVIRLNVLGANGENRQAQAAITLK